MFNASLSQGWYSANAKPHCLVEHGSFSSYSYPQHWPYHQQHVWSSVPSVLCDTSKLGYGHLWIMNVYRCCACIQSRYTRTIFAQIVQIIVQIMCEPKTSEENRVDYLHDFLSNCPECNARSLTRRQWLVDLYPFIQITSAPVCRVSVHACSDWLTYIYSNSFSSCLPCLLSRMLKCKRITVLCARYAKLHDFSLKLCSAAGRWYF